MKLLDPGKLRHRVQIQRMESVIDSNGDVIGEDWADVATVWAAIEPLSGRELLAAQAVQSEVRTRITMRFRSDVDATCRILHRGTVYNIAGIIPDPNSGDEWMTLPVSTGLNEG